MFAGQFKGSLIVVESSRQPGAGCMTGSAIGAELAVVMIVFLVTGGAIGGGAFVDIIGMATDTGSLDVRSGQFEGRPIVVVERCRQPGLGRVACPAVGAKLAIVMIVL